jgi:LysM repeat protein
VESGKLLSYFNGKKFGKENIMIKCYAKDVIKVATKYIGYLEKKSNKLLDDFTANAGKGNYTRFSREYKTITGVNYQAQPWCDQFQDVCFVEAFGKDKAKELLGGFSAYTPTSAQYFKSKNKWFTENPKVGDLIFFKNSLRICHIGIVTKVTDTTVYTIEGNTSGGSDVIENGGGVCDKHYDLDNPRIAGYGRPNYDVEEIKPVTSALDRKYAYEYYIVKSGDSLSAIANKYNTTVDKIAKLNNIKNINSINVGAKLLIDTFQLYTVVKGDSFSKISKKFLGDGNRYKEIMSLNGIKNTTLNLGQVLKIPNK